MTTTAVMPRLTMMLMILVPPSPGLKLPFLRCSAPTRSSRQARREGEKGSGGSNPSVGGARASPSLSGFPNYRLCHKQPRALSVVPQQPRALSVVPNNQGSACVQKQVPLKRGDGVCKHAVCRSAGVQPSGEAGPPGGVAVTSTACKYPRPDGERGRPARGRLERGKCSHFFPGRGDLSRFFP